MTYLGKENEMTKTINQTIIYIYIGENQRDMYTFDDALTALFFLECLGMNSEPMQIVVRDHAVVAGCEICPTDKGRFVPHDNCICGRNKPHCTGPSCF